MAGGWLDGGWWWWAVCAGCVRRVVLRLHAKAHLHVGDLVEVDGRAIPRREAWRVADGCVFHGEHANGAVGEDPSRWTFGVTLLPIAAFRQILSAFCKLPYL